MRGKTNMFKAFAATAMAAATLLAPTYALAKGKSENVRGPKFSRVVPPQGYDGTLVYIANGIFDPADPDYAAPTMEDFHRGIMGRDSDGIAARDQEAEDFFRDTFGMDFSCGAISCDGQFALSSMMLDPRWNYRAYYIGGGDMRRYFTRDSGHIVHDGVYISACISPTGCSLGGTFGGTAEAGSAVFFGEYLIQGNGGEFTDYVMGDQRNIHIRYGSSEPVTGLMEPGFTFNCSLFSDDFGDGIALGRGDARVLEDGRVQQNIRNILTFPAPASFGGTAGAEKDIPSNPLSGRGPQH